MMAAVLYGKEHLQVEPVAVPTIESGDILVRVKVALTCGTDVKVFKRGYHAKMIVPPAVFGHELAGIISEVSDVGVHASACSADKLKLDLQQWRVGDRVVVANSAPCGECFHCKAGQENICDCLLYTSDAADDLLCVDLGG